MASQSHFMSLARVGRGDAPPFRGSFFIGLGAVIVVGALVAWWLAAKSLPNVNGNVPVPGLDLTVMVYRDRHGVPSIVAETAHDVYVAQGYVTAQDRLFQMDLLRRLASGRLAEIVGPDAVESDRFYRTLLFREYAARSFEALDQETRDASNAYAHGVNALIADAVRRGALPIEFGIMGYQPEPWTPVDTLTVGRYLSFTLSGNWEGEAVRNVLRHLVGDDLALELFPRYPGDAATMHTITTPHVLAPSDVLPLLPESSHMAGLLPWLPMRLPGIGSNNWVVSGKTTKTGYSLLANDPHLPVAFPAIWYLTHLVIPGELDVSGVTLPGVPGILVGRNEAIAWGVTTTMADLQDLYIERRNPDNPVQFEYEGEWEDATVYHEVIRVKGGPDIPFEVVVTRHGPIISDLELAYLSPGLPEATYAGDPLALKWTGHDVTLEMSAVLQMNRAQNWDDFREAIREFFPQNFVFASVDGDIAYRMSGHVPIRAQGNGLVPVPGWNSDWEWVGMIPFEHMPELVNPDNGMIVTANNQVVGPNYGYLITAEWEENPYRANRIVQFLDSTSDLTVQDMMSLQNDFTDLHAATLVPQFLPFIERHTNLTRLEQDAMALLQAWDFVAEPSSSATLVWRRWWWQINRRMCEGRLPEAIYLFMAQRQANVTDHLLQEAVSGRPGRWVQVAGGIDELLLESYKAAVDEVKGLQGSNPVKWSWGSWHRTHFAPAGAESGLLRFLLGSGPHRSGGTGNTVAAHYYDPESGYVTAAAPWRQIVDFDDWETNAWYVLAPGQAGHFLSPWYRDQAKHWAEGQYFRHAASCVECNDYQLLMLKPAH